MIIWYNFSPNPLSSISPTVAMKTHYTIDSQELEQKLLDSYLQLEHHSLKLYCIVGQFWMYLYEVGFLLLLLWLRLLLLDVGSSAGGRVGGRGGEGESRGEGRGGRERRERGRKQREKEGEGWWR